MRPVLKAAAVLAAAAFAPAAAQAQDACPNAALRTGEQARLPDCRAYEQVSPVDKNGNAMAPTFTSYAAGGDRLFSAAFGGAAPTDGALQNRGLISVRGADWSTRGTDAPLSPPSFVGSIATLEVSDDLTKAIVISTYALTDDAEEGDTNFYVRDLTRPSAYTLAAAVPGTRLYEEAIQLAGTVRDATPDLSTFVFATQYQVLPDVQPDALGGAYLYFVHDGEVTLASRDVDGTPVTVGGGVAPNEQHLLSDDGTTVLWIASNTNEIQRLFRTTRDGETVVVSDSEVPGAPDGGTAYSFSTADGAQTFFVSSGLTADFDGGVYRYTASDGDLVNLTGPAVASRPPSNLAASFDILNVSPDGAIVWIQSSGPLLDDDGGPDDFRLYALDVATRTVRLAAVFSRAVEFDDGSSVFRFSPDGRRVAFKSGSVLPATGNEDPSCIPAVTGAQRGARCPQIYAWNARTPDQAAICVSCVAGGEQRSAAAFGVPFRVLMGGRIERVVTNDGRVFFNTPARLVAADTDAVPDVYQYTPGVGPALLSAGDSGSPALLATASDDGDTVFFHTAQRLVAQDTDDLVDVYAARTDGGIASQRVAPPAPAEPCEGEACKPAPAGQLGRPVQSTATLPPAADPLVPRFSVVRPGAKALRAAARSGRLTVAVKVTAPGAVSAALQGKLGGRKLRTVASATRRAARAQTVRVPLRLSKAARTTLRRGRKLSLRLTVAYSERLPRYRTTLTFKKGGAR